VDPESQTSSAFAEALSERVIIDCMRPWTLEPGDGTPECSARTAVAMASLSVDAAGNCAFAFHAAPAPPVKLWT
jgi:hypothetical protein